MPWLSGMVYAKERDDENDKSHRLKRNRLTETVSFFLQHFVFRSFSFSINTKLYAIQLFYFLQFDIAVVCYINAHPGEILNVLKP